LAYRSAKLPGGLELQHLLPGCCRRQGPKQGFGRTFVPARIRRRLVTVLCGLAENPAGHPETLRARIVSWETPEKSARRRETLRAAVKISGTKPFSLGRHETLRPAGKICGPF
jgi:hypothetical protein